HRKHRSSDARVLGTPHSIVNPAAIPRGDKASAKSCLDHTVSGTEKFSRQFPELNRLHWEIKLCFP
ncbi:hypothetical protein, partial [Paraburkholderia silvatlantica]